MLSELLEEHHSSIRQLRARIWSRSDGLCAVEVERFVSGDLAHEQPSAWSRVRGAAIVVESLPAARAVATRELESIAR